MVRSETVLESWKSIRADAALAVEEMPDGDLDVRPAPGMMSCGENARHILDAGQAFTELLLEGVVNFQVPEFREMMKRRFFGLPETATAAELAAALRQSIEEQMGKLAAQPPEFFAQMVTRWDGTVLTRLELLQYLKEHEITHRSQMFVCLRLRGITPVTTRRRQAKQV